MANPVEIGKALQLGLGMVYASYAIISDGVAIIFSPSHVFAGDVLQAMPHNTISLIVRVMMTFVLMVTAPLIVVPCGEMIEGKFGIDKSRQSLLKRIGVRFTFCAICTILSELLGAGFVKVVSFIGE